MGDYYVTHFVKTQLTVEEVFQRFLNSPYISEQFKCEKVRSSLRSAVEIAFNENSKLLVSIKYKSQKLIEYVSNMPENEDFTKEQLVEIIDVIQILLKNFPELKFEFVESVAIFQFKCIDDLVDDIKKEVQGQLFKNWKWDECNCKYIKSNLYYISVIGLHPIYEINDCDYEYLKYAEAKVLLEAS